MVLNVLDNGLRAEECLSLRDRDLDWDGRRVWVMKGKGGGSREVPMSSEGQRAMRRFLALTSECRENRGRKLQPMYSYVFCTEYGGKLNYHNALRDLKKIAKRLGMPWVGWHTFRRTFATQYLRSGGLLTDLQQILGHSNVRTTLLYLGNSIEEIVKSHDELSPLTSTQECRGKGRIRHGSSTAVSMALSGGFRKR